MWDSSLAVILALDEDKSNTIGQETRHYLVLWVDEGLAHWPRAGAAGNWFDAFVRKNSRKM